jgi:ribonucleoside-diphosphate reductase alpha chain
LKNYISLEELQHLKTTLKKQTRKGAMLSCLDVSHPDIEEYVRAKQESGILTKFNMSVGITDDFIKAVINDEMWNMSFKNQVYKSVKARDLYDLIMKSAYNRGEPGVIFIDNAMKNNPIGYLSKVTAANPCGEIPGIGDLTTVCLLGSLNLTMYVEIINNIPIFNWDTYTEDIITLTRMLDNVNDLTSLPLQSYENFVKLFRQFGMGINGLGSTLLMLDIPYNSKEAVDFVTKIQSIKENVTWQTSAQLAIEKGVFPAYNRQKFINTPYFNSDRITNDTKNMIKNNGVRNAKTTTQPPLGNSSLICDNVSNGIEPIFDLEVERKIVCNEWPDGLNQDNIKEILKETKHSDYIIWQGEFNNKKYYYEPHNRGLCEVVVLRDYGYQWCIDNGFKRDKSLITTKDLNVDDHINIQEIVQYYNNQSTSKTVNLPNKYSFSDFKDLYINGWKRGLVGLTAYRDGSMESVLNTIEVAEQQKEIIKQDLKLPTVFINGPTEKIKREGIKYYIHFSYLPMDTCLKHPIAIWITTNAKQETVVCNRACKKLTKLAVDCDISKKIIDDAWEKSLGDLSYNRLARMISLCLRHNIPITDILLALTNIEGDNISTLLTAIRKFLSKHVTNGTKVKGIRCLNCGGENMIFEAGCYTCKDCGVSKCG